MTTNTMANQEHRPHPPVQFLTCNLCRRYVVVTYRPIKFISCKKHVSDTCKSGELILIGTKDAEQTNIHCFFILILGAVFYI